MHNILVMFFRRKFTYRYLVGIDNMVIETFHVQEGYLEERMERGFEVIIPFAALIDPYKKLFRGEE